MIDLVYISNIWCIFYHQSKYDKSGVYIYISNLLWLYFPPILYIPFKYKPIYINIYIYIVLYISRIGTFAEACICSISSKVQQQPAASSSSSSSSRLLRLWWLSGSVVGFKVYIYICVCVCMCGWPDKIVYIYIYM